MVEVQVHAVARWVVPQRRYSAGGWIVVKVPIGEERRPVLPSLFSFYVCTRSRLFSRWVRAIVLHGYDWAGWMRSFSYCLARDCEHRLNYPITYRAAVGINVRIWYDLTMVMDPDTLPLKLTDKKKVSII